MVVVARLIILLHWLFLIIDNAVDAVCSPGVWPPPVGRFPALRPHWWIKYEGYWALPSIVQRVSAADRYLASTIWLFLPSPSIAVSPFRAICAPRYCSAPYGDGTRPYPCLRVCCRPTRSPLRRCRYVSKTIRSATTIHFWQIQDCWCYWKPTVCYCCVH